MPASTAHPDPRLVDGVLAVAMALVVAVVIAADVERLGHTGPLAYLFAVAFGALILLRRRTPRLMLVLTVLGIFVYYAIGLAPIGQALPAIAALYSAAEQRRTGWAVGAGVVLVGTSTYFRLTGDETEAAVTAYDLVTNVALAAAALALGVAVRLYRESRTHATQIRALTAAEQALEADRRLAAERVRIARDLHDSVGHTLSVIALHAGVAAEKTGRDDEAARDAIAKVREATSATLRELRMTVKVLRGPLPGDIPRGALSLAGIAALVAPLQEAGIDVGTEIAVPPDAMDGTIDAAAYRIVQEALTNLVRHANATRATVTIGIEEDRVHLRIQDDGRGPARGRTDQGQGIAGMRERASLLGGTLDAGAAPGGGFVVTADLPVRLES